MKKLVRKTLAWAALAAIAAVPAVSQAQTAKTRYPIVLVHGLYGYDSTLLTGDYFYGIVSDLRRNGATVLVAEVPAINTNEVRGESLLAQLRRWQATYGYQKFNLIGHSQGAPTARYITGVAPNLVASVTTVGGVNGGTAVADAGLLLGVGIWGNPLGIFITALAGNASLTSMTGALTSLSTIGSATFSSRFSLGKPTTACGSGPEVANGIRFYSATGTSLATNVADVSDAGILAVSVSLAGQQSDGLVGRCATHWGTVLKDNYRWNHLDEVNQVAGLRGVLAEDPVAFYRTQANRLKNAGL
jgi:triacylglycerol lipase